MTTIDCDATLGRVEFVTFPHVDLETMPEHLMDNAERWAARPSAPGCATDDETAIKVVDGAVEVVSEGNATWFIH